MEQKSSKNGRGGGPEGRGYKFLVRPGWILSHLFVVALVVLMVNLGFWQLRRLDQRKDTNARIEANAHVDPQPLPPGIDEAGEAEWRRFTVTGTYEPGSDVLVANRTVDGQPGYWIVTLLRDVEQGPPVAIVRGFVTRAVVASDDLAEVTAPTSEVTVTGYAQDSRGGGRFATGTEGGWPEISRVDLGELAERWRVDDLLPIWLQLEAQDPPAGTAALTPVPLPSTDEGPHLSYAVQWFLFSAIAVVGYPLVLRRHARTSDDDTDDDPDDAARQRPAETVVRADGPFH
jgi:cytochrome oxidase assembly protein ShyY1